MVAYMVATSMVVKRFGGDHHAYDLGLEDLVLYLKVSSNRSFDAAILTSTVHTYKHRHRSLYGLLHTHVDSALLPLHLYQSSKQSAQMVSRGVLHFFDPAVYRSCRVNLLQLSTIERILGCSCSDVGCC